MNLLLFPFLAAGLLAWPSIIYPSDREEIDTIAKRIENRPRATEAREQLKWFLNQDIASRDKGHVCAILVEIQEHWFYDEGVYELLEYARRSEEFDVPEEDQAGLYQRWGRALVRENYVPGTSDKSSVPKGVLEIYVRGLARVLKNVDFQARGQTEEPPGSYAIAFGLSPRELQMLRKFREERKEKVKQYDNVRAHNEAVSARDQFVQDIRQTWQRSKISKAEVQEIIGRYIKGPEKAGQLVALAVETPGEEFDRKLEQAKNSPTEENLTAAHRVAVSLPEDPDEGGRLKMEKAGALLSILQLLKKQQGTLLPGERGRGNFLLPGMEEGTRPEDIKNPVLRKKFEEAIAENTRRIERSNYQGQVSKLIEHSQFYMEKLMEHSVNDDEKMRILKKAEEVLGTGNVEFLRSGEGLKK